MKLQDIHKNNRVIDLKTLTSDGELVRQIQVRLKDLGLLPPSQIDGIFGPITQAVLTQFCDSVQLDNTSTGQFGKTFAEKLITLKQLPQTKYLSDADYRRVASLLNVEVAVIRAVVEVETLGHGFLANGRPKILFERHIFYQQTSGRHVTTHPDICNRKSGGYLGREREWPRLERAKQLNPRAALMSASWSLGQVMGFNFQAAGYSDVETFVQAMHQSEGKQLEAMMNFIRYNNLVSALRNHDWRTFARSYRTHLRS